MTRINVYRYDEIDGKSLDGWFDPQSSEKFEEDTWWNGSNHVSKATGDKFEHELLYRTKGGRWVLHHWSQWQGIAETYHFITDERARGWLLENDHDAAVERHFGPIEEERGPGRPEVGPPINVRFPQNVLDRLDARAQTDGVKRAELIRRLVEAGL